MPDQENNMLNNAKSSTLWLLAIMSACLFLLSPAVYAKTGPVVETQLKRKLIETIKKVRNGKTSTSRTEAAEYLETLTRGMSPQKLDDKTLSEIVSLLETKEDSVRAWVAASLGNLGPRAKVAVPRLLKLLPEVDCLPGSLTSAPFIRGALKRMGETPPPPSDCDEKEKQ
jgi:hypothetical protein